MSNRLKEARKRRLELEKKQRQEASKLQKLQKDQEERAERQYNAQISSQYSTTPTKLSTQASHPQFIMPGSALQPTYNIVNPYAGNHNPHPVPVTYDPAMYGVQYDANVQIPPQRLQTPYTNRPNRRESQNSSKLTNPDRKRV
uniref:Uncharacterized protein n=1 Tax=Euplotes crassus TaxID=5936 RepID=A0A7S3K969_EUPCR|mmetsp:Transcript_15271/g.15148  ORF Transcript_15271/g.15148 Transcript_15271/m.15148 type:complete len:143 (+) Transcript_15271:218-646(+)